MYVPRFDSWRLFLSTRSTLEKERVCVTQTADCEKRESAAGCMLHGIQDCSFLRAALRDCEAQKSNDENTKRRR